MSFVVDWLMNWGVPNPGALYPVDGNTAIYIDAAQWRSLSMAAALAVGLTVCVAVGACYLATRRVGQAFVRRWWLFAGLAAGVSGVAVFAYLATSSFVWDGQSYHVPAGVALVRALVALPQALVCFYLLSGLSAMLFGRFMGIKGFADNRQIPIPHLL